MNPRSGVFTGVHRRFESVAGRVPDAVAVVAEARKLTYGELNRRANRLARRLRRRGVGPEVRVGLCLERTPEAVVALLAVWKAGGAYVPLDPEEATSRLGSVLRQSGTRLVLASAGTRRRLPAGTASVAVEEELRLAQEEPGADLAEAGAPARLAYVIFTSGSGGRPKGVEVTAGALAEYLGFVAGFYGFTGADALLPIASLTFDMSVREHLAPLLAGARVVLVARHPAADPAAFRSALGRHRVTCLLGVVPSLAAVLFGKAASLEGSALRLVGCGGEPLPLVTAERLRAVCGRQIRVVNQYGPTECTGTAAARFLDRSDDEAGVALAGAAHPHASIFVAGRGLRFAAAGETGEVLIAGGGLARGYAAAPGETAARFVPHPGGRLPGERLYRTGDLGRDHGGRLEVLGRIDDQLKVRGHRIEPGEVESALVEHPQVEEAAVVGARGASGEPGLVAFYAAREPAPGPRALLDLLTARLPPAMVPSRLVRRDRLPRTPTGKVDRRRLAAETAAGGPAAGAPGTPYEPPRSPLERKLAAIWAEVLGRQRVGRDDDFLLLGGHSLDATRVAARIERLLGRRLAPGRLFESRTVAALAADVAAGEKAEDAPIERAPRGAEEPLSFAQQRLWFLHQLTPASAAYNVPTAWRLRGRLDAEALRAALGEVVRRHRVLRASFPEAGGEPSQRIGPAGELPLPRLDLAGLASGPRGDELSRVLAAEAGRPFDLACPPLMRAFLVRLAAGDGEHVLLLVAHHVVCDGWSRGILARELGLLYEAAAGLRPSPLAEPAIQYADFARWQRGWLHGARLESQLAYWRRGLADLPAAELPADRPRRRLSERCRELALSLDRGLAGALEARSREAGASLFMTLLAAFFALLHRLGGGRDLVIGTAVANRRRPELEELIGFFVNVLVLRVAAGGELSFRDLLAKTRAAALAAYAYQDLPFERLVEELAPERDLARNPLFQVAFTVANEPRSPLVLPGVRSRRLPVPAPAARFDLEVDLWREEGLAGNVIYNTDLFDATTVARLMRSYERLLLAVASAPGVQVGALPLLGAAERHQALHEWSGGTPRHGEAELLHHGFELQAERRGDRCAMIAVTAGGAERTFSYAELDVRANRLARHLRSFGVGPEVCVALYLERSAEAVVAVLAVAKAGGAYVPIDAGHGPARLLALLAERVSPVLVTRGALAAALDPALLAGLRVVDLDRDAGVVARRSPRRPACTVPPESLAYAVFTSGSTGRPKGVMVSNRALAAVARAWREDYRLDGLSCHLQAASFGFDVFTGDLARALTTGARLAIVPREVLLEAPALAAALRRLRIDAVELVPALALPLGRLLARLAAAGDAVSLPRLFAVGSERWTGADLALLASVAGPGTRLVNSYGVAEAAIDSSYFTAGGRPVAAADGVPLGRAFSNARLHVFDPRLRPLAAGAAGELHAAGPGLARGYLARPAETAASFVPDPVSAAPGRRLYRTGDRVRFLGDGTLSFLGRADDQVKVRGHRVEPGEAAAVLAEHPAVAEAAAVARELGGEGRTALVAYWTPGEGAEELRRELEREQVEHWRTVYDELDGTAEAPADPAFDVAGWISSYTGEPIPPEEMRDWLEAAVGRILALGGERVLEIGCGTGLVLWRVAPRVAAYHGTDFSPPVLEALRARLPFSHVRLELRRADDFDGLRAGTYDTVVLNSVVQYFPSAGYLASVLAGAAEVTAAGGSVFVGDVRSLASLEEFYASLERHRADTPPPEAELRRRIRGRRRREEELVVDPAFFPALAEALPRLGEVRILPKESRFDNELTRYRYDVVLSIAGDASPARPAARDWRAFTNDPLAERLSRLLEPRLFDHLRGRLPAPLVPSVLVGLETLPRTPSGKVDRAALPPPDDGDRPAPGSAAPRDPVEALLAEIWGDVLDVGRVGVHDDFFKLGGHSLLATRVISRVREAFHTELPLRALFEAPTVAGLARRLAAAPGTAVAPLAAVAREAGERPPSFAEERLWLLHQLAPESPLYNTALAWRLEGPLDAPALHRALGEVVGRHDVLRTSFPARDGRPRRAVSPSSRLVVPCLDLTALPGCRRADAARSAASAEAARPFDLERGPLARCLLLRLGRRRRREAHVLVLGLHHAVFDAASEEVLCRELGHFYGTFVTGAAAALPALPCRYGDFALWQRRRLDAGTLGALCAYWCGHLDGCEPAELPVDRQRTAASRLDAAAVERFAWPPDLAAAWRGLARRAGASPFMAHLAAFFALLHRLTGRRDLTLGTAVSNRGQRELEGLIGHFVNLVALRVDLVGRPGFAELLGRVRREVLAAHAHRELPFERLVAELSPVREVGRHPLFQVTFALHAAGAAALRLRGVRAERLELGRRASDLDHELHLFETGDGGLDGLWTFAPGLYEETTVRRWSAALVTLAGSLAAAPERALGELDLLRPAERHQTLVEWNDRAAAFPAWRPLHALVEERARRAPDTTALVGRGGDVSLGELVRRARRLAGRLQALGVGAESRVGVCLGPGAACVVALNAAWKAGGAYVALDPGDPPRRLAALARDAGLAAVVAATPAAEPFPVPMVCVDGGGGAPGDAPEPVERRVREENAAYVLYTSGSTGVPRGVVVSHGALCHHMRWMLDALPLAAGDRVLQKTPLVFDASVWEFWAPLLAGARLVCSRGDAHRDPAELLAAVRRHGVTVLQVVPSLLRMLVAGEGLGRCRSLRRLCCGGEPLTAELRDRFLAALPGAELVNLYGPTEATIHASTARYRAASRPGGVTLGRPIANTRLYVLGPGLAPATLGAPGRLRVAGPGLARGYLGRPRWTAERFAPDPFSRRPGGRLYDTGDRVRFGAGGELEYLGRADAQVKVRGVRLEPGEVEAALEGHPAVRLAVVGLVRSAGAPERLAAFLTGGETPAAELRAFLETRLPAPAIPSAFVHRRSFPRTAGGKVDRRALLASFAEPPAGPTVPPRAAVEEILAEIWSDVLCRRGVGVHDSFFALGGHSLLATRVLSRVRRLIGPELTLRRFFAGPTIAELAATVEEALRRRHDLATAAPPLRPARRRAGRAGMPLSFAQQRLWFLYQLAPASRVYNIPTAWRLEGELDLAALERSLGEVVRRHEVLRTTFRNVAGRPRAFVSVAEPFALTRIDLEGLPLAARRTAGRGALAVGARRPFDLEREPPLRVLVLRCGERRHVLLLNLHHIASDGWSQGILERELSRFYAGFTAPAGRRPPPPRELAAQYADFAVWQRRWLQGDVLAAQLAYWRGRLAGLPPVELPVDRSPRERPGWRGAEHAAAVDATLAAELRRLSRAEAATLFMTLLGSLATLLFRWTGERDLAVGAPIASRHHHETEDLIGFFVNTLVLRVEEPKVSAEAPAPSFRTLLGQVREICLAAYAHQDLPFERLVEELRPRRELARPPFLRTILALQNVPRHDLELPGLAATPVAVEATSTYSDLTVFVEEGVAGGLAVTLSYSTELFDRTTVVRLAGRFVTLLGAAARGPGRPLRGLDWLTAGERQQLLAEWNERGAPEVGELTVDRLFERQAARTPDAVAVVSERLQLSYHELDVRASRLARAFGRRGTGPEARIALYMDRSPELVAAVLAVLKAGAAYVPLDKGQPARRSAFLCEDSGARLLVFDAGAALPAAGAEALALARLEAEASAAPAAAAPPWRARSDNLAYVMYTSGSTGMPKGVAVTHRGIVRLVAGNDFAKLAGAVFLQLAPVGFDASTLEIWGPLANGGRLVVPPLGPPQPAELGELLRRHAVTTLWLTAGLFHVMAEERPEDLATLRELLAGGDAVSPAHAARALAALGGSLTNGYGPTEATTFTCCHTLSRPPEAPSVPIGRPILHTRVYVVDPALEPVAAGTPGELLIGGAGLARGYWGRPRRTAESFVPDPFAAVSGRHGERLYRSGDRVRHLSDGSLVMLGRFDDQLKVRGFRVEPGEVEAFLRRQPAVREAAVVATPGPGRNLVAYVVPQPAAGDAPRSGWELEHVNRWQSLYDGLYDPAGEPADTVGWSSSYTGRPIPAVEMEEWLEATVERILRLRLSGPWRILEIGCGTGMVLRRLAPHAASYVATDFSRTAVERLRTRLGPAGHVRLARQAADDFTGLAAGGFETVVLNSVAQYFPSAEYLLETLRGAVRACAPGGSIFVGDVRSLPLLDAYCASVELFRADGALSAPALKRLAGHRRRHQEELLVDPAFFFGLRREIPRIGRIRVEPKAGRRRNELTLFRYDVTLELDAAAGPALVAPRRCDWAGQGWTLTAVGRHLARRRPGCLALAGVPNARLSREVALLALLARAAPDANAADLRRALARAANGVEPEDLLELGRTHGYRVELSWARGSRDGSYDALFRRPGAPGLPEPPAPDPGRSLAVLASDPLGNRPAAELLHGLRQRLGESLPDYMVPSSFVVLDALPLTANGKVDRRALSALGELVPAPPRGPRLAPRGAVESVLVRICESLVDAEHVGVDDDFFALGGHSLLAVQLMAKVERRFGKRIPLASFFREPTMAGLARAIERGPRQPAPSPLVGIRRTGTALPFFCVHAAGGHVTSYRELARRLGPEQPVYGLEAPEADDGTEPFADVSEMASAYLEAVSEVQPRGPYFLGGWSMGGVVAYEMARQLEAAGREVAFLALLDASPPDEWNSTADLDDEAESLSLEVFARDLGLGRSAAPVRPGTASLDRALADTLDQALREKALTPEVDLSRMRRLFQVFENNVRIMMRYPPRPYGGKVSLFCAADGRGASSERPGGRWHGLAAGGVDVAVVPGDHFSMLRPPSVDVLAERLSASLRRAQSASPTAVSRSRPPPPGGR